MDVVGAARASLDALAGKMQQLQQPQSSSIAQPSAAEIAKQQEAQAAKDTQEGQLSEAQLKALTDELNSQMSVLNTSIRFGFNDKLDQMYVNVIDSRTKDIIRKVPSDEIQALAAKMKELIGIIFDKKA